jgi:hypothetical protein
MSHEKLNPASALAGAAGSEFANLTGCSSDFTTTALALKKILTRVAVSPSVALVIAVHAGLLREVR